LLASSGASIAVIQVGKNSFGHPTRDVLDLLDENDLPIYRNDQSGAILINPAPGGFRVQTVKRDFVSPILLKPHEK
jgi:beta-lactamase superfamily II metal-dependent hydrolase